jgi:hypothetical protein
MAEQTGQACAGAGDRGCSTGDRDPEAEDLAGPAGLAGPADLAEAAGLAGPADLAVQADGHRSGLIEAARARWIAALTDLGGRNTLHGGGRARWWWCPHDGGGAVEVVAVPARAQAERGRRQQPRERRPRRGEQGHEVVRYRRSP